MLRSTLLLIAATSVSAVQLGCFSDNSETLSNFVDNGTFIFQSTGYCQRACYGIGYNYYALKDGEDCWCGDAVPPISDMVDDSNCNLPCPGYARQNCMLLFILLFFCLSNLSLRLAEYFVPLNRLDVIFLVIFLVGLN
jgi:cell wall integrity and stress response component